MLKTILITLLPLMLFIGDNAVSLFPSVKAGKSSDNGTLERLVPTTGNINLDLDMARLTGQDASSSQIESVRFETAKDSFFTVVVYNGELRGPMPSSLGIVPKASAYLPEKLASSYNKLVIESLPWGNHYDLVVRDGESGFIFFNIEGYQFEYSPDNKTLRLYDGRMLISREFAEAMGRPESVGTLVGTVSVETGMRAVEVQYVKNGEVESAVLPAGAGMEPGAGTTPGPDVIVGDVNGLAQFGSATGSQVGLALGTDSCNAGVVNLNWAALPSNDHPVIPQNMYRMSGGADNAERFEQIGQSQVKHGFTALTQNICGFGCNGVGGSQLGSGCSDPYSASLNAGPSLGSRAWINPFTGFFPRGDSATPPNTHTGHTGDSAAGHRMRVEIADLNTTLNQGATYYAEGQYVTPHEYRWCDANPTQCNMNNNVSYRRYNVFGTASPFSFSPNGATVRMKPAIYAWTGASLSDFQPAPLQDGVGIVGSKVTNTAPGVWHYEYAVYNQNLDRGIQSFSIPIPEGVTVTNIGFKAPPQHPGYTFDGTVGNTGYSSTPWAGAVAGNAITWSTETLAQNPNANAIRWGTLYNFRFDANVPPASATGTVGFYKTGDSMQIRTEGPSGTVPTPTPTPVIPTPTPTPTPTPVIPTPTPTPTPVTPTPTPTPTGGGWEGDVVDQNAGPAGGDGVLGNDVTIMRQFALGLIAPVTNPNQFQRGDSAPRDTSTGQYGDGRIDAADVTVTRQYVLGTFPQTQAGGPMLPILAGPGFEARPDGAATRTISAVNVAGQPGQQVVVSIVIAAQGNESSTSFSVTFDPTKLSNPVVTIGNGVPAGSNLGTNLNNVAQGQIGILVDSTNTYTAGTRQIVTIRFNIAANAQIGLSPIGFGGTPTAQSVSSSTGALLTTVYTPGTVQIGSTAAGVELAGKVLTPDGRGVRGVVVSLRAADGTVRTATTNSFGFYRFEDVDAGDGYVVSAASKRYRFASRVINVVDSISDADLIGLE